MISTAILASLIASSLVGASPIVERAARTYSTLTADMCPIDKAANGRDTSDYLTYHLIDKAQPVVTRRYDTCNDQPLYRTIEGITYTFQLRGSAFFDTPEDNSIFSCLYEAPETSTGCTYDADSDTGISTTPLCPPAIATVTTMPADDSAAIAQCRAFCDSETKCKGANLYFDNYSSKGSTTNGEADQWTCSLWRQRITKASVNNSGGQQQLPLPSPKNNISKSQCFNLAAST